ncbi:MAG: glutamate--cysteine ligase [Candidimonas sp.]|jgi:glutamate--cysteine ligase
MTVPASRHTLLENDPTLLQDIKRGIEKEGLRVTETGKLADTGHPPPLGAALTHERITTDYSEALLELITPPHDTPDAMLRELEDTHRFVSQHLDRELIWNHSMPAHLPPESDIPIARYGKSNSGMLKHVYRAGLAERYGKAMQCIAGVHYNFSLPDALWNVIGIRGSSPEDQRSKGYLALIRNFTRFSWLLMYLFGASPAVSRQFLQGLPHDLEAFDDDTLYLPHATSLRMSDLGYKNKAQSDLELCYNDLETFLRRMHAAVTTPWPPYEAIGTHRDGRWVQLNTNVLQIENEYYSSIRPKRTTARGERPISALALRGVQYVEVRCLDIDPFSPIGISKDTAHFLDVFLLYCAMEESAFFPNNGFCRDSNDNFSTVVKEGRKPGLVLIKSNRPIGLQEWGRELVGNMAPYARLLDHVHDTQAYGAALAVQAERVEDPEKTLSAQWLQAMRDQKQGQHEHALALSLRHRDALRSPPLPADLEKYYQDMATTSFAAQKNLEDSDTESFDSYVARYQEVLKPGSGAFW